VSEVSERRDHPVLLVATQNRGKILEIKELLHDLRFKLKTLLDYPDLAPAVEDGTTFQENAIKKAVYYQALTGLICLADDSGLEVDALGGAPGVFSARFAGDKATDELNNRKLLKEMQGVPLKDRKARFCCFMAIALPTGEVKIAKGSCEGIILDSLQGEKGFGYDPLFFYPPAGKTFAQMSPEEKNRYSHRAKALLEAKNILQGILT